jgi:hypothetical protein
MSFNGFGGLIIHGMVASEFGYLLRYLTVGKLERINEFEKIREEKDQILLAITNELGKSALRESEVFRISREDAIGNMNNLRVIIECICDYVDLCRSLDIELFPDENTDQRFTKILFLWIGGAIAIASAFSMILGAMDKESASTLLGVALGTLGGLVANIIQSTLSGRRKQKEKGHD